MRMSGGSDEDIQLAEISSYCNGPGTRLTDDLIASMTDEKS